MEPRTSSIAAVVLALGVLATVVPGLAQEMQDVEIRTTDLGSGVYMLQGRGGNIGVSAGEDGVFLVDDQYAPLTERIIAALAAITDRPIRFILNTHFHGDHTGGNENMGEAGVLIVAHENVRKRLSVEQFDDVFGRQTPTKPEGAWPVVTFTEAVTFHMNGDEIHAFHAAHAHTDGDAIITFRNANVVHIGDVMFNGMYPRIDVSAGGSIDGTIAAADAVLAMIDDDTKIIPGHGPLAGKADLQAYRDMLAGVRAAVAKEITTGKDRDGVIAAKPTADFDEEWGDGYFNGDIFTRMIYADLSRK